VVWRLDRLGRPMTHWVTLIQALLQRHVSFRSLSDGAIDTTTASGELVFHIFSAPAQFERRLIQECTHAGLAAAHARGKNGGRTPRHAEEPHVRMGYTMYVDQSLSVRDICRVLRISQATFYRYVALDRRAAETTKRLWREEHGRTVRALASWSGARQRTKFLRFTGKA
jgi:DNA invertase Pin-like site-specific DNA recombinase